MSGQRVEEVVRIADEWYVLATSSRADDRTRVLKNGDTFALFDRSGDIHGIGAGELGLYHGGARFLSRMELRIGGQRPMLLNSSVRRDNSLLTVDLTTPDLDSEGRLGVRKGTVHVFRAALLWEGACHTRLRIVNYGDQAIGLSLTIEFRADYADIFEVRGFRRERRGRDLAADVAPHSVVLGYEGLDGRTRRTRLAFSPAPQRMTGERAEYFVALSPQETNEIALVIECDPEPPDGEPQDLAYVLARVEGAMRETRSAGCRITTSNLQFNDWLDRSGADLAMLTAGNPEGCYPYAGVPWYSTPFGRDGILTALQYLWVDPTMARGVLAYLAAAQADADNEAQESEPGKILHEVRRGELAALGEIPFGCYYGSVDSTPLFVVLAADYFERTTDVEFVQSIWPHVERALEWIDRYGDIDGDGFVEYRRRTAAGLRNQGWRDSEDAVYHRDGRMADAPIALCEVQGYVYRAKLGAARLAQALGLGARGQVLRREARELRVRFERAFWCEEIGSYRLRWTRTSNLARYVIRARGRCSGAASPSPRMRAARRARSWRRIPLRAGACAPSPRVRRATTRCLITTVPSGRTTTRWWPPGSRATVFARRRSRLPPPFSTQVSPWTCIAYRSCIAASRAGAARGRRCIRSHARRRPGPARARSICYRPVSAWAFAPAAAKCASSTRACPISSPAWRSPACALALRCSTSPCNAISGMWR